MPLNRRLFLIAAPLALVGCGRRQPRHAPHVTKSTSNNATINRLITKYANRYDVPEDLVHRVVKRESTYNPNARNGPYMGLMQIHPDTARGMGYRGTPEGLLDPETNLNFSVKYLRGAWLVSDGSYDKADMWYQRGYYYEAKRRGMLKETGLR